MTARKIAVAAAGLLLAGCGQSDLRADAYDACEQAVEEHFGSGDVYGFSGYDKARVRNTDGVYEVAAYIDSTNGLGEPSQIDFTCQLRRDLGSWKLIDLDFS